MGRVIRLVLNEGGGVMASDSKAPENYRTALRALPRMIARAYPCSQDNKKPASNIVFLKKYLYVQIAIQMYLCEDGLCSGVMILGVALRGVRGR
jgi:hypothetical protein